jgi:hypothetical protein
MLSVSVLCDLDTCVLHTFARPAGSIAKISGKIKDSTSVHTKKNFPVEPAWNTAFREERKDACAKKSFSEQVVVAYCTPHHPRGEAQQDNLRN